MAKGCGWHKLEANRNIAIVFVHGILSNCEDCFTNEGTKGYWPQIASVDQYFEECSIFLCNYYSALNANRFSINSAADYLSLELQSDHFEVEESSSEPKRASILEFEQIIFICHSMGGLIVKDLLCRNPDLFATKHLKVVFCGTPSLGSRLMRTTVLRLCQMLKFGQALQLRFNSPTVRAIDEAFIDFVRDRPEEFPVKGMELVENLKTKIFGPIKVLVVPHDSGYRYAEIFRDSGWIGQLIPDADHSSICKPADEKSDQHRFLTGFAGGRYTPPLRHRHRRQD